MAQKKKRTDEISFDSGNAVKYNKITNLQGNPKKVALFFCPDRGLLPFAWLLSRNIPSGGPFQSFSWLLNVEQNFFRENDPITADFVATN